MNRTFKAATCFLLVVGGLLGGGCTGPRYSRHQLVIFGTAAPVLAAPFIPTIQTNLLTQPAPKVGLLAAITGVGTTPFKCLGIQGWKDYQMCAEARGAVVQHRTSSDGFLTVDLRLDALAVNGEPVPLPATRFLRLEIFRGKVSIKEARLADKDSEVIVHGKLVWDYDGWFEIHPQKNADIRLAKRSEQMATVTEHGPQTGSGAGQ